MNLLLYVWLDWTWIRGDRMGDEAESMGEIIRTGSNAIPENLNYIIYVVEDCCRF